MTGLSGSMRSRRGSYAVFITLLFSAVLIMVTAVLWVSSQKAIDAVSEEFGKLWGRSILAEYDVYLKDRYGIFAYRGSRYEVREKLEYYSSFSFEDKDYITSEICDVGIENYGLSDPDVMKRQITELMKEFVKPIVYTDYETDGSDEDSAVSEKSTDGKRKITSRWILGGLPSKARTVLPDISGIISDLKERGSLLENTLINKYIFLFFKDYMKKQDLGKTYFENEVEYIITGEPNDVRAKNTVYAELIAIREALNMAYLLSDEEKHSLCIAAGELITPGMGTLVTDTVIISAWAALESVNDLKLLYDNKKVPVIKTDSTWAISLDTVLNKKFNQEKSGNESVENARGYVEPEVISGLSYDEYLNILLNVVPEKTRLLRIMDLIQINMKYLYWDGFVLDEYYTGLDYSLTVNGKKHDFKETYF